jgi:hypothetical protein
LGTAKHLRALSVVHVNGPINSGKSTVGRALACVLSDARFVDGDDYDVPCDVPLETQWAMALMRIEHDIAVAECRYLIVAFPIDRAGFEQLNAACKKRSGRLIVVTLSPPLEVALSDRGERRLTPWERQRIDEMYRQGYQSRPFSDIFLDTSGKAPEESADVIAQQIVDLC